MVTKELKRKSSQKYLTKLAGLLYVYPGTTVLIFIGLTLWFGWFALKLEQETTIRDLLPSHNQVVQNFEETVEHFDLIDRVVIVVQFRPELLETAEEFADIFVEQTLADPASEQYLVWLKANLFDTTQATNWYQYIRFLTRLLPPEQLPELVDRLQPENIDARIAENRRQLASGLSSKTLIEHDPLHLVEFASPYSKEFTGNYRISFTDGFLVSKSQDMLLILGKPRKSPEDVGFSVELTDFLLAQVDRARQTLREENESATGDLLEIGLTGPHPITAYENKIIRGDVVNMFVTSLAMVLFLFILAYGRPLALIYVGVPLLFAEVWTLGIGYLLFGRLNLLTATFSAVIVGLGIDYAIHLFSRYLDELSAGHSPLHSMRIALSQTGLGTIVGGVTTALAFAAMGFSDFSGLREFGVIASIGILLCLLQMFILLPCLLFLRERIRRKAPSRRRAQWDFHVEKLLIFCLKHKKPTIILLIAISLVLAWEASNLHFNTDIRSIRARSNPSITLQNTVTEKVGGSLRSLTLVLEAPTEQKLYQLHDSLMPVLSELKDEGKLVRYDSLLSVVQNPDHQRKNIAALDASGLQGEAIKSDFEEAMNRHAIRLTPDARKYIENLALGLDVTEPIRLSSLLETESGFVRPFLNRFEGKLKTIVYIYPSMGLWEKDRTRAVTGRILEAVGGDGESRAFVTGIQSISDELKRLVRESFKVATGISIALVFLMLFYHFRCFSLVMLTLTPLLVSVVWMLGTMKLLGIDITVLNFVATPLIIGIGIDDGVHIVEKYLYRKSTDLGSTIAACGKAVTLTSLTTIFGFSSLFLAEYSGFQSLGLCAILGVFFCWVGSVVLLPLIMALTNPKFVRGEELSAEPPESTQPN